MNVDHEIKLLQEQVKLLGKPNADGHYSVAYGVLFKATEDIFEAILGTLKAAKKRKIVTYEGLNLIDLSILIFFFF